MYCRWYVGDMSRQRAESLLKQEDKEGCFVVRNSSTKGLYTLSLYTKVWVVTFLLSFLFSIQRSLQNVKQKKKERGAQKKMREKKGALAWWVYYRGWRTADAVKYLSCFYEASPVPNTRHWKWIKRAVEMFHEFSPLLFFPVPSFLTNSEAFFRFSHFGYLLFSTGPIHTSSTITSNKIHVVNFICQRNTAVDPYPI